MKTYIYLFTLCAALAFVGCGKENDAPKVDNATKVVGEWHCAPEGYDVDVYVEFVATGEFDEYYGKKFAKYEKLYHLLKEIN